MSREPSAPACVRRARAGVRSPAPPVARVPERESRETRGGLGEGKAGRPRAPPRPPPPPPGACSPAPGPRLAAWAPPRPLPSRVSSLAAHRAAPSPSPHAIPLPVAAPGPAWRGAWAVRGAGGGGGGRVRWWGWRKALGGRECGHPFGGGGPFGVSLGFPRGRGCRASGGWWLWGVCPPAGPTPARPRSRALSPPPFQVPSAFRRGGLKTPRGPPVRPGSGAVGPLGVRAGRASARPVCPPMDSASPPSPSGSGRVGWEPPGRLWGCSPGGASPRGAPCGETLPTRRSLFLSCRWPARGTPTTDPSPALRGLGERGRGGGTVPRQQRKKAKTRTTLSGGSLGSCVDEERS